jgi:hypothetical protein
MVNPRNFATNRKAESRALVATVRTAPESLEQHRHVRGVDAATEVAHANATLIHEYQHD